MAAEAPVTEETRKRGMGKLLFLAVNVLLFVAGAGFFVLTKFGVLGAAPSPQAPSSEPPPAATPPPTETSQPPQPGIMVRFDPFIVNLSGDQGRRYLRVILQVEVPNDEAKNAVTSHMPQLRDRLIFLLSSKKFSDIHSIDGKYQLREEILRHLNEALGKEIVKKVYFTEFIVQ